LLIMPLLFFTTALAQEAPIKISLVADDTTYGPNDPIEYQIRVFNDSGQDVIAREGFLGQDFHLMVTFIDPDGVPITNRYAMVSPEPGPSHRYGNRDVAWVEIIPSTGSNTIAVGDAHAYYSLTKYGWYTGQVQVALETFSTYDAAESGNLFSYLDDRDLVFNPLASNTIRFEIVRPEPLDTSSIKVHVNLLQIGQGTNPGATKEPLEWAEVQVIRKSDIPSIYEPINWKVYNEIWGRVDPVVSGFTGGDGIVTFEGIEIDDYLILAQHPEFSDFKHMGSPIGSDDEDWLTDQPIEKHLMVMLKPDKKKVPGKTKKLKGSELLITEPEYVEWDSTEELYPFVFETIGDWGVTTSVAPPEGFVTDHDSLSADVNNEMEAVQFTITDQGSRWEETDVTFKVKHKGKNKNIKTKIGIKLSKKLQKKKGVGPYGHTPTPGPFKGGKKVGHKK